MEPTGATTVAAVIGDPVVHSRSPAILNSAFGAMGLDWVYVALTVAQGQGRSAAESVRTLGLGGMSVTMPHKADVIPAMDELSEVAARLGAVNCIERSGDRLIGHNTDGEGFIAALRAGGFEPSGARCVVLGAGGAARAVCAALVDADADRVVVVNRSTGRAEAAAALAGEHGAVASPDRIAETLGGADLLVNATPVGMGADDASPVPSGAMHEGLHVSDLIYHPATTSLMEAAEAAGATAGNGLGMLVHQAAVALRIWTGREPPIAEMSVAAQL